MAQVTGVGSGPLPLDATLASGPQVEPERRGKIHVRGVARSVQQHKVDELDVLSFRVEQYDAAGNRLAPVGVELRPYRGGQVSEGEEVDVTGRWENGSVRAKTIVNRTTGANLTGGWSWRAYVALPILAIPFLGVPAFIIYEIVIHGL